MNINSNKLYTIQNIFNFKHINISNLTLEILGFFIFIYFLWENKFFWAIGISAFFKMITFVRSLKSSMPEMPPPTQKEENQMILFLFSKTLAALALYYGIWSHSFETIFIAINLLLLTYLISWIKIVYSDL